MLASPACQPVFTQCTQFSSSKENTPIGRTVNAGQHVEKSRFPTARRPGDGKETLSRHAKGHIIQNGGFSASRTKRSRKVFDVDQHRGGEIGGEPVCSLQWLHVFPLLIYQGFRTASEQKLFVRSPVVV